MLGKTLAHYKILSHIGTGGMGEVYRAHDTKLDREVALKALPVEFSKDPERVARFEREATTLAKLQHANIAAIYGFDKDQDRTFLVMELVEGVDLSERLLRGPIPASEAIGIASQIAEGLEAAHALGIVHRDLKPANIKITPTGDVKLLDFGLARAYAGEDENSTIGEISNTPTITAAMTMQGVILGTAAYMSPEQARGKSIDRQADIWSFGVVFFEMLTAERLFGGETISDSIGAILHRNPDLTLLPDVPPQVTTLLRRCLAREKKERLRDIGDARLELADAAAATTTEKPASQTKTGRTSWIAMAAIALLVTVVGWLALTRDQGADFNNVTLGIPPERAISLRVGAWTTMRYSADGQKILFAGGDEQKLYLNDIGEFEAVPVSNIDDASMYDFSPDGLWIAYFADSKLWKVAVSGGAPIELCETPDGPGLSWGQGEIFFVGSNGGGIWSVPEEGGEPRQVSTLDQGREETSHRWPHVLPGGRHLLLTIKTARIATFDDALIGLLSLDTGEVEVLLTGGTQPQYSTTGHIIYGRESQLFAVPFDLKSLAIEGTPSMVLDQVYTDIGTGSVQFALNAQGGLAYIPVRQKTRGLELSWLHLTGFSERLDFSAETYYAPAISPDGKKLAGRVIAANDKIHIFDLERQTLTRLTNTPGNDDVPIWSPDGSLIAYSNDLEGIRHIFIINSDGGAPARKLVAGDANNFSNCWTPDGKRLLFSRVDEGGKAQIWVVSVDGSSDPEPVLVEENSNGQARLSPDGRWLAYLSDSSGQVNVYIRPFERAGGPVRVSIDEGFTPRWAPDGSTLYFVANDKMMAAPVSTEGGLRVGAPEELFELDEEVFGPLPISPDGEKFLANLARPESEWHFGIRVVRNWVQGLEDIGK
jgi:serine/threonine-protein kinase